MTSSHKISFSIIDILDPNKFNSKRVNELSIAKFPVSNAEGPSLDSDTAGEDFRAERRKAGRKLMILIISQAVHLHGDAILLYICIVIYRSISNLISTWCL